MTPHEDDRIDQRMSRFLSAAGHEGAPPDEAFLARLREESAETFMAAPPEEPARSRRYRIMEWRNLKWLIPAAVAAAVLLAVGLWPGGKDGKRQPGQAYAFGDMPELIGKARYLHIQGIRTLHMGTRGTGEAAIRKSIQTPIDDWFDLSTGAKRSTTTTARFIATSVRHFSWTQGPETQPPAPAPVGENEMSTVETVCDGQYEMAMNPEKKTATFTRLSPVLQRLTAARAGTTALQQMFDDPSLLGGFAPAGTEEIDGVTYEIWQLEAPVPNNSFWKKTQCWFSPKTGNVARVKEWTKFPFTNGEYVETMLVNRIERDAVPPAGTFETVAPAGYTATNTKETAPVRGLRAASLAGGPEANAVYSMWVKDLAKTASTVGTAGVPDKFTVVVAPFLRNYPAFVLPDGSVILGTSSREIGGGKFAGVRPQSLTPGKSEELQTQMRTSDSKVFVGTGPELRMVGPQGSGASPSGPTPGMNVVMFSDPQASTAPQDDLFANLTPGGELPKTPVEVYALKPTNAQGVTYTGRHLGWTKKDGECIEWALYVPDGPPPAGILGFNLLTRTNPSGPGNVKSSISVTVQAPVRIDGANFDGLVTAAMAELNDGGTAPADVSFQSVTQLAQQIRASLGSP